LLLDIFSRLYIIFDVQVHCNVGHLPFLPLVIKGIRKGIRPLRNLAPVSPIYGGTAKLGFGSPFIGKPSCLCMHGKMD